ncbi:hypothetical protein [Kitasatospora sp. NPDC056731]|uniref:hypothetical protein n=1 Tax=Kitasatospora sp. NPDC056731 TaxID=3155422 RepID=UPI00342C6755
MDSDDVAAGLARDQDLERAADHARSVLSTMVTVLPSAAAGHGEGPFRSPSR